MSNIIKSFRVIEEKTVIQEKTIQEEQNKESDLDVGKAILAEARHQYLKIISDANKGAEKILVDAYSQAEKELESASRKSKEIYIDAKKEGYNKGFEKGNEEGYKIGYEKGYEIAYEEGKTASEKLIEEALDIKEDYIQLKNQLLRDTEEEIIELVIAIYEKVLYQKVEEDEELIISLVLNGIDKLEVSEKLTIIVSSDDYEIVNNAKNLILAKASLIDELDIRINSDMKKGDCMIETSMGSVDVGINNQLDEVKDLLNNILSNE